MYNKLPKWKLFRVIEYPTRPDPNNDRIQIDGSGENYFS